MNLGLAVASSPIFVRSLRTAPICKPIAEILIFSRTICLCEENTFLNLLDGKQQRFGLCKAKRIFSHLLCPLSLLAWIQRCCPKPRLASRALAAAFRFVASVASCLLASLISIVIGNISILIFIRYI